MLHQPHRATKAMRPLQLLTQRWSILAKIVAPTTTRILPVDRRTRQFPQHSTNPWMHNDNAKVHSLTSAE